MEIAEDALEAFIEAAAGALALPLEPAWMPSIKGNLQATLRHAALVDAFALPDGAEPAPVFEA
jgi:hypothetical protein